MKIKKIEELKENMIYSEETISQIIYNNENCKAIYKDKLDAFMFGKQKIKLIKIFKGYETIKERNKIINDQKEYIYLYLEPLDK